MNLMRAAATVGGLTLMSRVMGFVRDVIMASMLGAGWVADAFVVAFKLPNFFRRLFAEGAFNAAFVPLYAQAMAGSGPAVAHLFAERIQAVLAGVLLVLTAVALVFMPWVIGAFAPGFAARPDTLALAIELGRITFPYLLLISLMALYAAVLNAGEKFAAAAAAPVLLNLCLIAAMLGWGGTETETAFALAWGVAAAGVAQLGWMIAATARAGIVLRPRWPRAGPEVRRLLILMGPVVLAVGVAQVNTLVDTILASLIGPGAVTYLYFADRLNQLPLGVVGIAMGTALLPALSTALSTGKTDEAGRLQNRGIELAMLLTLPAAAGLIVLAGPIVSVLFARGAFTEADAVATGWALTAYAAGLPAYVGIKVLAPGFFARQDTKTPTWIAAGSMALNIPLSLLLMGPLGHVGLAVATAVAAWANAGGLAIVLIRRGHLRLDDRSRRRLPRQVIAALAMAAACGGLAFTFPDLYRAEAAVEIAALAGTVAGGALIFFGLCAVLGAARPADLKALRRGRITAPTSEKD